MNVRFGSGELSFDECPRSYRRCREQCFHPRWFNHSLSMCLFRDDLLSVCTDGRLLLINTSTAMTGLSVRSARRCLGVWHVLFTSSSMPRVGRLSPLNYWNLRSTWRLELFIMLPSLLFIPSLCFSNPPSPSPRAHNKLPSYLMSLYAPSSTTFIKQSERNAPTKTTSLNSENFLLIRFERLGATLHVRLGGETIQFAVSASRLILRPRRGL